MRRVYLKRIKKSESGNPVEDEWKEIRPLGEKIDPGYIADVQDRRFTFQKDTRGSFDRVSQESPEIKDKINNTTQFMKLVKTSVVEKQNEFEKFKEKTKRFDAEVAKLQPKKRPFNFDLSKLNYKEIKVDQLKTELEILKTERESIRSKITHFSNQLQQAQLELRFKVEQIEDIKRELERLEKREILRQHVKSEEEALSIIKRELNVIKGVGETKRVFETVNALVNLLKSKNQMTLNELYRVRSEYRSLKQKYDELMEKIK